MAASEDSSGSSEEDILDITQHGKYFPTCLASKIPFFCNDNDIIGNFYCCGNPVIIGHMTDEDMRLKFKYLHYIRDLPCPFGCLNSVGTHLCLINSVWVFKDNGKHIDCRLSKDGRLITLYTYYFDFKLLETCGGTYDITELDRHFLSVRQIMAGWRVFKNKSKMEPKFFMIKIMKLTNPEPRDKVQLQFLSITDIANGWRVVESKYLNDSLFENYQNSYLESITNDKLYLHSPRKIKKEID